MSETRIFHCEVYPQYRVITHKNTSEPALECVRKIISEAIDLAQTESEPEEIAHLTKIAWKALTDYLSDKTNRQLQALSVQLKSEIIVSECNAIGTVRIAHIEISDFLSIDDPSVREIQLVKVIIHEMYHSLAIKRLQVDIKDKDVAVNFYSYGVQSMKNGVGAFEEGLAVHFENRIYQEIKPLLPEHGVQLYDQICEDRQPTEEDERIECVILTSFKQVNENKWAYETTTMPYSPCLTLVELLNQEIPNFFKLAEKARIDNHPLPLCRAIEGRFGKGSFRDLLQTHFEDGKALLERFKERAREQS